MTQKDCGHTVISIELLAECIEALAGHTSNWAEHQQHIRSVLLTEEHAGIKAGLELVAERMVTRALQHPLESPPSHGEHNVFEQQIISLLSGMELPRYVYHGTVAGRLQSIYDNGLMPGAVPVWNGKEEHDQCIRSFSDTAVFFSPTWRYALSMWAFIAHKGSRGPKASVKRAPAVIRLNMEGLHLERDPAALNRSLMVKGTVPVHTGEVIIGFDTVFPVWRPLGQVLQKSR